MLGAAAGGRAGGGAGQGCGIPGSAKQMETLNSFSFTRGVWVFPEKWDPSPSSDRDLGLDLFVSHRIIGPDVERGRAELGLQWWEGKKCDLNVWLLHFVFSGEG